MPFSQVKNCLDAVPGTGYGAGIFRIDLLRDPTLPSHRGGKGGLARSLRGGFRQDTAAREVRRLGPVRESKEAGQLAVSQTTSSMLALKMDE